MPEKHQIEQQPKAFGDHGHKGCGCSGNCRVCLCRRPKTSQDLKD